MNTMSGNPNSTYTVQSGDSFYKIYQRVHPGTPPTSTAVAKFANTLGLDAKEPLKAGNVLVIPTKTPQSPETASSLENYPSLPQQPASITRVVQGGDTPEKILREHFEAQFGDNCVADYDQAYRQFLALNKGNIRFNRNGNPNLRLGQVVNLPDPQGIVKPWFLRKPAQLSVSPKWQQYLHTKTKTYNPNDLKCTPAEFITSLETLCNKYHMPPDALLSAMYDETGGSFSPATQTGNGPVGLIQITGETAQALGTSKAALKQMSAIEQLDVIDRYFEQTLATHQNDLTEADTAIAIFYPAKVGIGNNPNATLLSRAKTAEQGAYNNNRSLDRNNDGHITVAELTQRSADHRNKPKP